MRETLKRINTGEWLAAATMVLAYVWGGILEAIPQPSEGSATWISHIFPAADEAELILLDVAYTALVSFAVVIASYTALSLAKRRREH
jgi:hypothetical protein